MSFRSYSPESVEEKDPFALSDGFEPQRGMVKDKIKFLELQTGGTKPRKLRRSCSLQETSTHQLRKLQNGLYSRTPSNTSSRMTTPMGSMDELRSRIPISNQGAENGTSIESVPLQAQPKPRSRKPSKAIALMERCDSLQGKVDALQEACNTLSEENKTYREEQNISNEHLTTISETCDSFQHKLEELQAMCTNLAEENRRQKIPETSSNDMKILLERLQALESRALSIEENKISQQDLATFKESVADRYCTKLEEVKQDVITIHSTLKQDLTRSQSSLEDQITNMKEQLRRETIEREKILTSLNETKVHNQKDTQSSEKQQKAEADEKKAHDQRKAAETEQKRASDALKVEIQSMSRRLERMSGDFKQNVDKLENRMLEKFKDEENMFKETLEKLEIEKLGLETQLREAATKSENLTAEQAKYKEYLRGIKMTQQAIDDTSYARRSFFRRSTRSRKKQNMVKLIDAIAPDGSVVET